MCSHVRTGSSISIFNDSWIIGATNYRILNLVQDTSLVLDLINNSTRKWKAELIKNTFAPTDAKLILRIPLVKEAHDNELAWSEEPSGVFSVRSSYKLLQSGFTTSTLNNIQANKRNY